MGWRRSSEDGSLAPKKYRGRTGGCRCERRTSQKIDLARLRNQQELAGGAARSQEAQCFGRFGEREGFANRNRKATLARELEDCVEAAPMNLAHSINHRHDDAADFERLREQMAAKVDWLRRSAG